MSIELILILLDYILLAIGRIPGFQADSDEIRRIMDEMVAAGRNPPAAQKAAIKAKLIERRDRLRAQVAAERGTG